MQFFRKTLLGVVLICTGLQATAQVIQAPSAPTSAPATLPAGVPRPGQAPGGQLPGQTGTTPRGQTQGTLPGATQQGTRGQAGQTGAGQQGANQQGGRGQAGQGTGTAQQGQQGQQGQQTGAGIDANGAEGVGATDEPLGDVDNTQLKTEQELQRERELAAQRRKLFGYQLFNDPANGNTFQPNLNIATPKGYVVGPNDELNINIYGYSEATYPTVVNPDGFIYIQRVGPIHVAGLTIEQAKSRILERLSKIYVGLKSGSYGPANTYMVVTLGDIRSIRVTVTGEAIRPGTYTVSSLSTAMNVIYQAGGPSEIGSFRNVQVIRNNRVVASLDLYDFLTTGVQRNDVRLQDNDNIRFTTYKAHVEITGSTRRNNIFEMLPGEPMARLLELAGGFTSNAYKARIKVTRFTKRELKMIDVVETEFPTFPMEDGDQVSVEAVLVRFENQVGIQGAVFRPGVYSLDQNKTLRQLIASAEGLKGDAFTGRIQIVRTREDMAIDNISLNLADIINGAQPDVQLQREDQVIIPSRFEMAEFADISITGEVITPIEATPYVANMTLEDLILRAGGLKESAAAAQIEIVRRKKDVEVNSKSAQVSEIYRFNVDRDLTIKSTDSKFMLYPYDQVIVRRSPNYRIQTFVTVEGEVVMPGEYPVVTKDQRISDLVKMAGGLTPFAYVPGATLVREIRLSEAEKEIRQQTIQELADDSPKAVVRPEAANQNTQQLIGINLEKIMNDPGSMEDMILQEGDELRIPKQLETVRVGGEVLLPTTAKYRRGQSFQDYISQAGGFTSRSARKRAYVVYANGSADRTRRFAFFNVYPRVEPGSEIIVPQSTKGELTPLQIIQSTTGVLGSVMTLIVAVLSFRALAN
ncbi:protein involved in polysaccharide export with SLBB domain [Larkinella arboricola]|uniref:Protein involved in polysaccharide export with SLBB domain n=1 Tax=Larkinella arboricola TaxID=643671 RepID=A0A327WTN3_LARAB|nr:SLBB domain-containing protein [Larkinella arboricola]RAJ92120.1 protein involved in polysaccharide export with SLBB domain [Larkinella arboricola]